MRAYSYADLATYLEELIERDLPNHATEDFDRVRSGDDTPDDIFDRKGASGAELIISSPNDMRGMVATWLYYRYRAGNIAQSIYREALNAAWNHDHHQVRQFVRNNRLQLKSALPGHPVILTRPAHPHALLLRGGDLVADAFTGDLALELGKGQLRRSRVFGQLPGRNKLKAGSRLLVSRFPEINFMLSCCGVT
jgi:hypothetical protein